MRRQRQTQQSFISPSSQSVQVILGLCRRVWYRLTAKKSCLISTKSKTTVIFLLRFLFCLYHKMWPGKIQCFKTVLHFKGHCQELWLLPWRLPKDAGWSPARWKKTKNKTHLLVVCSSYQHNLCESCVEGVRPPWLAELLPPGLVCRGAEMWWDHSCDCSTSNERGRECCPRLLMPFWRSLCHLWPLWSYSQRFRPFCGSGFSTASSCKGNEWRWCTLGSSIMITDP